MADGTDLTPVWGAIALAVVLGVGGTATSWSQSRRVVQLQEDVENLQFSVKKLQAQKAQAVSQSSRGGADRAKAAKANAGGAGAAANRGSMDPMMKVDMFAKKNNLDADKAQKLKGLVKQTLENVKKIGADAKAGKITAAERQPKMLAVLKQRNEQIIKLLGEEVGGKAVALLSAKASGGQAKAKAKGQRRPGSRLPQ